MEWFFITRKFRYFYFEVFIRFAFFRSASIKIGIIKTTNDRIYNITDIHIIPTIKAMKNIAIETTLVISK